MSARGRRGSALPAALVAVAVALALASAVTDLMHTQAVLARNRRSAARALAKADACLAAVVAGLRPGWSFDAEIAGPDGVAGTPDDGQLVAPAGCTVVAEPAPGPPVPARMLLTVEGRDGGGRRILEAVVRRADAPGMPAVLWHDGAATDAIAGALTLDGRDPLAPFAAPAAAVAAPLDPVLVDGWIAASGGHVDVVPPTAAPIAAGAPPIDALVTRAAAAGPAPGGTFVAMPPAPPALTLVHGDLVVDAPAHGAGLLVVDGRLDIDAAFTFIGVVVASDGVRVTHGGSLEIAGGLWVGSGALQPLDVQGTARVVASTAGHALADAMLPLPRRGVVAGIHDPG